MSFCRIILCNKSTNLRHIHVPVTNLKCIYNVDREKVGGGRGGLNCKETVVTVLVGSGNKRLVYQQS